jgi:site-specific DNA-methyltransferase (adenine-specific)
LIPKAWGTGVTSTDMLKPFLADTPSCCTETYLVVGPFETKEIAGNVLSYINTKFFHFMVSIKKITQNSMQDDYQFVPMQDFRQSWTDEKLYKKYNLSEDEINFIESMIKQVN